MKIPYCIKGLYYITHINNLPSILERGILSHSDVEHQDIEFTPVFDHQRAHPFIGGGKATQLNTPS